MGSTGQRPLREFGQVFDGVAAEYDAVRPSYPDELIDAAVAAGGLDAGSAVLEIGSGTGKLTELLVARGLRVRAIEPGVNLVAAARKRIGRADAVEFDVARFEDAALSEGAYDAAFSATAFHWIDPKVGWAKVASLLEPGGLLALLTHIGLHDERSAALDDQFTALLHAYVPALAHDWKPAPTYEAVVAGVGRRAGNVSEAWDWIMSEGRHGMAIPEAATLFRGVEVAIVTEPVEDSADDVLAHMRTTSMYFMVEPTRREAFEEDIRRLVASFGGTLRWTRAAVLMTARTPAARASL